MAADAAFCAAELMPNTDSFEESLIGWSNPGNWEMPTM